MKETASQQKEETVTSTYAYDYRRQLVRVRQTTESGPVIEREYAYDLAGNRILEETTSDGEVIRRVESEFNDAGQMTSQDIWEESTQGGGNDKPGKPDKDHDDNGHHYGNDKGDNHEDNDNRWTDNGHHYGGDKPDNHVDKKGQTKKNESVTTTISNANDPEAIAANTAELFAPAPYDAETETWRGKVDSDRHVSYTYDENGNLIGKSGDGIDNFTYQYDNENRLRAVMQNGTVLMAALYDGNGDRIFKLQRHSTNGNVPSSGNTGNGNSGSNKKDTSAVVDSGAVPSDGTIPVDLDLLEDVMLLPTGAKKTNINGYDLTGYINDINQQYTQVLMEYGKNGKYNSIYSYGLQRLGADYNGAQTTYLYDGRGSMVNETNGSGTSMSAYLYDEWGSLLSGKVHTNGFYSDNYLYNAEAMDITTELYYLRARYYDPSQGRFMQQDTFLGYIDTPISQNLYIYCYNSPLNYIDPSGNDPAQFKNLVDYTYAVDDYRALSLDQIERAEEILYQVYKDYSGNPIKKNKLKKQYELVKAYRVALCENQAQEKSSIFTDENGFDETLQRMMNNYAYNVSLRPNYNNLFNRKIITQDGLILSQQELEAYKIGASNVRLSGCGAISTYNAMKLLNRDQNLSDILLYVENYLLTEGALGISPVGIETYFKEQEYLQLETANSLTAYDAQKWFEDKGGDVNIIVFLRDFRHNIGAHYVAFEDAGSMNSNGDKEYHLYEDELWNDSDIRTIEQLFSDNGVLLWYGYSIKDLTP